MRKTVRCHSEWKETKGCRLFLRSQRRGAFPELQVKLFQCIVKRICIYGADPFLHGMYEGVFLLFSFDCLFSFFQPVHEKRGERGKDAEGDEYPADGSREQNGDIIARKGQASAEASFADRS